MVAFDRDNIHFYIEDRYVVGLERLDTFDRKLAKGKWDYDQIVIYIFINVKYYRVGRDWKFIRFKRVNISIHSQI